MEFLEHITKNQPIEIEWGKDPTIALEHLKSTSEMPDLVLVDYQMPKLSGLEFIDQFRALNRSVPIIFITAHADIEALNQAHEKGVLDCLLKPLRPADVNISIRRAISFIELERENRQLKKDTLTTNKELIGQSSKILHCKKMAARVAGTDSTVLINGESGTGKEVFARLIHSRSNRSKENFVAVNCAAIPRELLESELFGHKKGAFTGANENRAGLFEIASKGTLLLDEIGDLPLELQVKLLRVLQEKKIRRVGSSSEVEIDARIICATHKNLAKEVQDGNFREDLFYRISVFPIQLPALRERENDIALLAQHFFEKFSSNQNRAGLRISSEAMKKLLSHTWPGNVRELENTIERSIIMCQGSVVSEWDIILQSELSGDRQIDTKNHNSLFEALFVNGYDLKKIEYSYVKFLTERKDLSKEQIADHLGINRKTLYRKEKELEELTL